MKSAGGAVSVGLAVSCPVRSSAATSACSGTRQERQVDPWIVAEVGGADRWAVIARWD